MSVVLKSSKGIDINAAAGTIIGKAQKAQEEWELQKATMNSQQDFQHQQALRQTELDAQVRTKQIEQEAKVRAEQWELEKATMRSQVDFQREERKRQTELDETDNKIKAIKKAVDSGQITKEKGNNLMFSIQYDIPYSSLAKESEGQSYGTLPGEQQYLTEEERQAYNRDKLLNQPEKTGAIPWYLSPKDVNTKAGIDAQHEAGIYMNETERLARAKNVAAPANAPQVSMPPAPADVNEFADKVAELKATNIELAKKYYEAYAGQF